MALNTALEAWYSIMDKKFLKQGQWIDVLAFIWYLPSENFSISLGACTQSKTTSVVQHLEKLFLFVEDCRKKSRKASNYFKQLVTYFSVLKLCALLFFKYEKKITLNVYSYSGIFYNGFSVLLLVKVIQEFCFTQLTSQILKVRIFPSKKFKNSTPAPKNTLVSLINQVMSQ